MKNLLSLVALVAFSLFTTPYLYAADASPVSQRATDGTGFELKDRFNELYSGKVTYKAVTYAATTNIDFSAAGLQAVTLTGNVTFTGSSMVAGNTCVVKLLASGGSRNLAFPGGWIFVGAAAPTALASGKTAILVLRSFGTAAANVVARYDAQP